MGFIVKLTKADGSNVSQKEMDSLYLSDLQFRPLRKKKEIIDGKVHIEGHSSPVIIHAMMPVMDYGYIWVTADNQGEGYSKEDTEIDFVREAAMTRLVEIQNILESYGGELSSEASAHISACEEYLQLAEKKHGDKAYEFYHRALSHGLWGGELALFERSKAYKRSNPVFMLGCAAFGYEPGSDYAARFEKTFDLATLPFYLKEALKEEKRGYPNYDWVDKILAWCKEKGIRTKGHPLWWNHVASTPEWLMDVDWETMKKECIRTVKRSVERYRNDIQIWDVVNEVHDWSNLNPISQDQMIEITRIACDAARESNPDATLIVNNCLPFGEYVSQGLEAIKCNSNLKEDRPLFSPYTYLEALFENNVEFDVIGIQLYWPTRDMVSISRLLDEYLKFGKPIHITELGICSGDNHTDWADPQSKRTRWPLDHYLYGDGIWHAEWEWTEKIQADWLEQFYTMTYSKENIEALTWWSFYDPGYVPLSGLIRKDGVPKESYYRLHAFRDFIQKKNK